jgi:hypothetical protein
MPEENAKRDKGDGLSWQILERLLSQTPPSLEELNRLAEPLPRNQKREIFVLLENKRPDYLRELQEKTRHAVLEPIYTR